MVPYRTRHEFRDPRAYYGLSLQVTDSSHISVADQLAALASLPGVESITPVYEARLLYGPDDEMYKHLAPSLTFSGASASLPTRAPGPVPDGPSPGNLDSALQMGGVDKLHLKGYRGKGVKIGIIDTGVDYRHPALGGGFGAGFKIAGGWSYVDDAGKKVESADPFSGCFGGGHGTHVTGT